MPQYATGKGCNYRIQKANQPGAGAFMRCDSQKTSGKIHFRSDFLGLHPHSRLNTPGDGSAPAVQRHSTENSCSHHQLHGATGQEHQRSIMVKRQAYDGLPGSVKAILTLFFL